MSERRAELERDGFIVIPGFASASACVKVGARSRRRLGPSSRLTGCYPIAIAAPRTARRARAAPIPCT
ncbi:hypothetical protein DB30_06661 [Enhygromyxa salina]|uniref:Uncharacterized protein n=1 Tax=Enhygromyxa salina TaxID=215803 RepID=A0A0C2CTV9_9BACT|nr:hypothetical protein DB30_06661 [Enhygromyxa salina]